MVGFLAEPVFIVVFWCRGWFDHPYRADPVGQADREFFRAVPVLLMIAFLMLILGEDGRIPVDSPSGQFELAMIMPKSLEYSPFARRVTLICSAFFT